MGQKKQNEKGVSEKLLPSPSDTFDPALLNRVVDEMIPYSLPLVFNDQTPDSLGWKLINEFRGVGSHTILFKSYRTRDNTLVVRLGEEVQKSSVIYASPSGSAHHSSEQGRRANLWSHLSTLCVLAFSLEDTPGDDDRLRKIGSLALLLVTADTAAVGKARQPELVAKERGAAYQSGLMQNLTALGRRPRRGAKLKSGKNGSPRELLIIWRTVAFIRCWETLPTKRWLRTQLESEGMGYSETRGQAASKWAQAFQNARLDALPE